MTIGPEYETILFLVFQYGGVVFGGFVRDFLAGDEPKDIDIKFKHAEDVLDFAEHLSATSFDGEIRPCTIEIKHGGLYENGFKVHRIRKQTNCENFVDIDVSVGDYYKNPDLDVNMLEMPGEDIIRAVSGYSLVSILENIKKRQALVLRPTHGRLRKLEELAERGWKLEGLEEALRRVR